MTEQETMLHQMGLVPSDARKRFVRAGSEIAELAWRYRNADFHFADNDYILEQVLAILRDLSVYNQDDAEKRARQVLLELELDEYSNDAIQWTEGERNGHTALWRYDQEGSHFLSIMETWIAASAIEDITREALLSEIQTHIEHPWESRSWKDAGFSRPHFGKGYQSDVVKGAALIGQDIVSGATRFSQIRSFRAKGAIGYRTVRASSFDCPYCDEMSERVWPMDETVLPYHPRCVCVAVPVFLDEI